MSDLQFQSKHSVEVSSDDANLNTFSYLSSRTVLDNNKSISTHAAVAIEEEVTVGEFKSRNYVFDVPNKGQYLMSAVLEIHGHNMDTTKTVSDHIERIELLQHSNRNVLLERLDNANLRPTADAKMVEGTYDVMNTVSDTIFYPLNFFFSETFRHLLLGKSTFSICVKFYNNSVVKNATLSLRTSHVYLPFGEVDDALTSLKQPKQPSGSISQSKIPFTARTSLYYNLEGLDSDSRTYRLDIGDLGNHLKSFNVVSDTLTDKSMLTLSTNKNGTNPIIQQSYQYFKVQSRLAGHTVPGFHFDLVDELAPTLLLADGDLARGAVVRVGGGAIDLSTQKLYLHITGLAHEKEVMRDGNKEKVPTEKTLRLDVVHEECLHRDLYGMFYSSQNFLSDGISRTEPMSLERV